MWIQKSRIISTDEDPSLRIESSAIINLRGVSTKLNKNIAFIYHWKWKIRSAKQSTDIIPVVFNSFKMVQLIVEIAFYAETEQENKTSV